MAVLPMDVFDLRGPSLTLSLSQRARELWGSRSIVDTFSTGTGMRAEIAASSRVRTLCREVLLIEITALDKKVLLIEGEIRPRLIC